MSKIVCLTFLLATLLTVISPTAAAGLEERWRNRHHNRDCCPVAICEFEKGDSFDHRRHAKRNINPFDGFIQFTETFNNQLFVSGFLDAENFKKDTTAGAQGLDVHVADCNLKSLDVGLDLDEVDDIFDRPFVGVIPNKKVSQLVGKCCILADDKQNDQIIAVAKVKQAIKCGRNKKILIKDL
ncbi:3571_t:CDS:1 [Paraglomus brasilianum]|uniref:3571_t:CDS:1 n=1 Tax=Paraglomus brasilianum TaxID=144538 RepID=A0A9N9CX98_9GLOM|nr:3571_t:CDS:1 [Paraglomus brasilianum]